MKTGKKLLIRLFVLSIPIILILYYFLFPRFIYTETNIATVPQKIENITYELSFTNTLHDKKQNLLFEKRIYGPPYKAMLMIESPPSAINLVVKKITVFNSKKDIIFEQKINEHMTFAKQPDIWVGSLFCEKDIHLNDDKGVLKVELYIGNKVQNISFELNVVESKDCFSLFYAGLSI
jgi:hypothetical protein